MKSLQIDVFSDIACPFCYIGELRLERVLKDFPDVQLEWTWHPFQLQPALPKRGVPWDEFSRQKFGGLEQRRAAFAQVVQNGSSEGVQFDFERMPVAPNTLDAHRLVQHASSRGLGHAMALRLFEAYFTQAVDITDPDELERLAVEVGLETSAIKALLESDEHHDEVQRSQLEAEQLGIRGVPFYIFNRQYALSGAQPSEMFEQAIRQTLNP
jgi:predicted DsbA family dithiol-disulfide isomerase